MSESLFAPLSTHHSVCKYFAYVKLTANTPTVSVILPEHNAHSGHTFISLTRVCNFFNIVFRRTNVFHLVDNFLTCWHKRILSV